jgi:F-type H+-transporting ATPase subunit alpha
MTRGYGRSVPVDKIQEYEAGLLDFMRSSHPEVGQSIISQKRITDEIEASLKSAVAEYNQSQGYSIPEK